MDQQVRDFLTLLAAEGAVKHAFKQVLNKLADEQLTAMRAAVNNNRDREAFACLKVEAALMSLPDDIQRILKSL